MLRLQACTGSDIPPDIEAAMLENTWRLCDNPTGILLEDPDPTEVGTWYIHSYRETMLALGLLVAYRGSEKAHRQGLRAIAQMRKASQNLMQWELSNCDPRLENLTPTRRGGDPVYTHGRAIEGLLCFHEATGAPEALEEVERLAEFHFQHTVNPDGSLATGCGHHTHSYLNTIRGLLMLASFHRQEDRLETILATYKNAISRMVSCSGFVTHDIGARFEGDIASTGDIAHIAVLLWNHFKDPQLLDDAERLVRCRLIPVQVCEAMPLKPRKTEQRDCFHNLPERFVGAIGGSGHLRGQICVTDYTAASLHSLVELYERTVDITDDYVRVNFHFDYNRSGVHITSVRDGTAARLIIRKETGKAVFVRIPAWAPESSLRIFVNDKPQEVRVQEGFASIPGGVLATQIQLHYSLPEYTTQETWRDEFATQEFIRFTWRGDQILEADPDGPYLAPFAKVCGSFLDLD
ncbi:MAG: hypothetical protein O2954_18615 [bacterium]|nr:hypothetical protein [bacterium]